MGKNSISIWNDAPNGTSYYSNVAQEFNKQTGKFPTGNTELFREWIKETYHISNWKEQVFYFDNEADYLLFLLRW